MGCVSVSQVCWVLLGGVLGLLGLHEHGRTHQTVRRYLGAASDSNSPALLSCASASPAGISTIDALRGAQLSSEEKAESAAAGCPRRSLPGRVDGCWCVCMCVCVCGWPAHTCASSASSSTCNCNDAKSWSSAVGTSAARTPAGGGLRMQPRTVLEFPAPATASRYLPSAKKGCDKSSAADGLLRASVCRLHKRIASICDTAHQRDPLPCLTPSPPRPLPRYPSC